MSDVVLGSIDDGVCTVTLNRPERRNAMNAELLARLNEVVAAAAHDPEVAVLVLRGAGDTFCVGGDVKAMASTEQRETHEQRVASLRRRMEVSRLLHTMNKPTIALVRGAAAGAGLSLAMACDFRLAARSAKITTAFAKVGLSGDFGGTWFITRLVGSAKARELYLMPEVMSADTAFGHGLLTRVFDDADIESAATAFARSLARGPRVTLGYIKQNLNHAELGSLETALDLEAANHIRCSQTEDHREAATAFVEKREPVFKGR